MTSGKRAQKFPIDGVSPPTSGSTSDWSCSVGNLIQPFRTTTQILAATRHQYGISVLVSQTSFGGETSGSIAKCRLFSQANTKYNMNKNESAFRYRK